MMILSSEAVWANMILVLHYLDLISVCFIQELKGETWVFNEKAIVFLDNRLIGGPSDLLTWAETEHNYQNFRPTPLYETLAEEAYKNFLNSQSHDYVYMDVTIGDVSIGRLVFEVSIHPC